MARAFRYDGIMPAMGPPPDNAPTPDDVRAIAAVAPMRGEGERPYDIVLEGTTPADDPVAAREHVQPLAQAGATWWIESPWDAPSVEGLRARIAAGPPV